MKKRVKRKLILFLFLMIIVFGGWFFIKTKIVTNNLNLEINQEYTIKDIIKKIKNGSLQNQKDIIVFDALGKQSLQVYYKDRLGLKHHQKINITVVDTISPEIEANDTITTYVNSEIDLTKDVKVTDNSKENIKISIQGKYDLNEAGTYNLEYIAKDSSGNVAKKSFKLVVEKAKKAVAQSSKYYVKINKTFNVAMVYGDDENGEFTNLIKTFIVSTGGDNTPNGVFTTTDRYETLSLVGGVWGHYTIRIDGAIWFHSVPYFSKPSDGHWNDLEYEEFNKLGTSASLGCVRLSTIDAKWLYDNLPWHTQVEIYESDKLPEGIVKPTIDKIDIKSSNRGWDPTDPDPENPWNL